MGDDRDALAQAMLLLDAFIARHRAAAIPAMIGACVGWAVENGGAEVMRGSLKNAIKLVDSVEAARRKEAQ